MSTEDFSVSAVCREAAVMVRRNLLAIVIACIPLIIVHSIFVFMYPEMTGQDQASVQEGNITGFYFVTIVLYPLVAAMAAVRVHRIYLVGDYMHSALDVFRLSAREFRFIGWWILFGLMMMLVIGIPIFVLSFIYIAESGEPDFVAMAFYHNNCKHSWLLGDGALVVCAACDRNGSSAAQFASFMEPKQTIQQASIHFDGINSIRCRLAQSAYL